VVIADEDPGATSVTEPALGVRLEARRYRRDRWVCRDG